MRDFLQDFVQGMIRALGIVAGFMPTALSFGAIAVQAQLSQAATLAMSVWIFAGASQFAAIEAIRQGLPWISVVLTVLVMNLRHVPMSLAIVRKIYQRFPAAQRWLLCHGIVDETFALEMSDETHPFAYYLGMHLGCWASWVAGTWVGAQLGVQISDRWLQFALPALFLYLLVDACRAFAPKPLAIILGCGIALTLTTASLGSMGLLISILGVTAIAVLLTPNADSSGEVKGSQ